MPKSPSMPASIKRDSASMFRLTRLMKKKGASTFTCTTSATPSEGQKVIDLNRFPSMEGSGPGKGNSALFYCDAPGKVADVMSFYRKKLTEQGWTEAPGRHEDETLAQPEFAKAGFVLEVFISKSDKPGRVNVRLENKGNVKAGQLPRLADA